MKNLGNERVKSLFTSTTCTAPEGMLSLRLIIQCPFYRFSECKWSIPRGESCVVGPSSPDCIVENMLHFIGDSTNCSVKIDKVQNDENGEWKV